MLRNIQGWDFVIILVVVMLLFGARKLPDLARSLGASAKEFRKGMDEGSDEDEAAEAATPTRNTTADTTD